MNLLQAVILGVVEGLTEFLPISSTGHMILVGHWLGIDTPEQKAFTDAFEVVIQCGALGAVLVYYRSVLKTHWQGLLRRESVSLQLWKAVAVAFAPVMVVGLLLHKKIEALLFGPKPVALALVVGGLVMLAVDRWRKAQRGAVDDGLEHVSVRRGLIVGLAQCLSLWPGTSRSMTTIVAGQLSGLSDKTAADFTFLVALPVLGAATGYKLLKARSVLFASMDHAVALVVGTVVAFMVAWAVIASFLNVLKRWGMTPFGVYRVIFGAAYLLLASNANE